MSIEAYPLAWPPGRPRTPRYARKPARFSTTIEKTNDSGSAWRQKREITNYAALSRLREELALLCATDIVVSTNIPTRKDGLPYSSAREPDDPGVAVHFRLKDQNVCLACDRWDKVAGNLAAIAAHVDAIRGQARWGVGDLAQAFAGYRLLTAAEAKKVWWQVLGFKEPPAAGPAEERWRTLMMQHHPDRGGSDVRAAEINAAWAEAEAYYKETEVR